MEERARVHYEKKIQETRESTAHQVKLYYLQCLHQLVNVQSHDLSRDLMKESHDTKSTMHDKSHDLRWSHDRLHDLRWSHTNKSHDLRLSHDKSHNFRWLHDKSHDLVRDSRLPSSTHTSNDSCGYTISTSTGSGCGLDTCQSTAENPTVSASVTSHSMNRDKKSNMKVSNKAHLSLKQFSVHVPSVSSPLATSHGVATSSSVVTSSSVITPDTVVTSRSTTKTGGVYWSESSNNTTRTGKLTGYNVTGQKESSGRLNKSGLRRKK